VLVLLSSIVRVTRIVIWPVLVMAFIIGLSGGVAGARSPGADSAALAAASTPNAADTWVALKGSELRDVDSDAPLACASALDCWAVQQEEGQFEPRAIVATTDGGASWTSQGNLEGFEEVTAITCGSDTLDCWIVGMDKYDGLVYATTNGGQSWALQPLPAGVEQLNGISCPTADDCVAVGGTAAFGGAIATTTDGGATWTLETTAEGPLNAVSCSSAADCLAAGGLEKSVILATTDGGTSWVEDSNYPATNGFDSVSCPTSLDCYVGGFIGPGAQDDTEPVVDATTDGGETWSLQQVPGVGTLYVDSLSCPTSSDCMASNTESLIETADGGKTWTALNSATSPLAANFVRSVVCPTTSTCYGAGGTGNGDGNGVVFTSRDALGLGCTGSLPTNSAIGLAPTPDGGGYWLASTAGGVVACGTAAFYGSLAVNHVQSPAPIVAIAAASDGQGYYLLARDGSVYPFGPGATTSGSGPAAAAPYVGMAVDQLTGGYWLVAADGGVFSFGARFHGSLPGLGIHTHAIVGVSADDATDGYWLVGSNGGVYSFSAPFHGSVPGLGILVNDVAAIGEAPAGIGYFVFGADGGVFTFGSGLHFCGAAAGETSSPVVAASVYPYSGGYWLLGGEGELYGFDAPDDGNAWASTQVFSSCL
jgi:photosystem II stability/assembly factor-like uncharacterized protein